MLKFALEKYISNLFYQKQIVWYRNILGDEYQVLSGYQDGSRYILETLDEDDNVRSLILGGHEILYVDYVMESLYHGE